MKHIKRLKLQSAIITLKLVGKSTLVAMEQDGIIRKIGLDEYKTLGGFKTNIKQERSWGNHLALSASGKFAASVVPNSNKAAVYNIETKELMYTTGRHQGDLESVCIDDNNHYLVTGGTDGKTYVWNLQTGRLTYSFPPHADYITSLDINNVWIVSASYDKTISVLNLTTMKTPIRLKGHKSVVVQMKLLKNMRMISADKDGNIIIWNLKDSKLLYRFTKMYDEITTFAVSEDEKLLFVGTRLGYVSLYDIQSGEWVKKIYLKEETKVTSLCVIKNDRELAVGTKNAEVLFYSLAYDENELIKILKSKEYNKLYEAAIDNPLLQNSAVYIKLEELWQNSLKTAVELLETEQNARAQLLLEPFKKVKSKNGTIQQLFNDYREFKKFKLYVHEKRYFLAYSLAAQHKYFIQSKPYISMENEWHIRFNKAKAMIFEKDGEEKVRKLLSDFKGISSKSVLMQELFKQRMVCTLFSKKLAQKDYTATFLLVKKHPFIKEFDEYDRLIAHVDRLYAKAKKSYEKREYKKVVVYATELLKFPDMKEEAQEMIDRSRVLEQFGRAFDNEDMSLMYEMIGRYPYLIEEEEAKALEDDWNYHLVLAEKYASKADAINASAALEDFFEIKSKHAAISIVMQQAYFLQLQRALRANKAAIIIENAIKQYVAFFGINENIEYFFEQYSKKHETSIILENLQKGDGTLFRPSMIVEDILKT